MRTELEVIEDIAHEIITERQDQNTEWGQQDHPSLFSEKFRRDFHVAADRWKQINDARVKQDRITWDGILLEEVYEALAESDEQAIRAELVQVAAVAAAWIEAIDRRLAAQEQQDEIEAAELAEIEQAVRDEEALVAGDPEDA